MGDMHKAPKKMLECITKETLEQLRGIDCLYVSHFACDASQALRAGAVLLAVAVDHSKDKGDGFRYLIGLPKSVKITEYLSHFFSRNGAPQKCRNGEATCCRPGIELTDS